MTGSRHPVFAVPFSWASATGHLVELLVDHVEPGLVVQIGAGRAPAAERLRQRGFEFAAVVESTVEADDLAHRGFVAAPADLTEPDEVLRIIDDIEERGGSPIRAVLLVGLIERLADPDALLQSLGGWLSERPEAMLGVTATNIAHRSVAVPLLRGRFRPIGSGLHHHTRAGFADRLAAVGLSERVAHDLHNAELKPSETYDPGVSEGAQLGSFLHSVRDAADPFAATTDFVGLFQTTASAAGDRSVPGDGLPAITVLAPEGTDSTVMSDPDAVIVTYRSTDDLGEVAGRLPTDYVVIVDGGERMADSWVAQFVALARRHPGAIIRCASIDGGWPAHDSMYGLVEGQTAPNAAFAIPVSAIAGSSVPIGRRDGRPDLLPLLLDIAPVCGIVDSGVEAVAVSGRWQRPTGDEIEILDRRPLLTPVGSGRHLAGLMSSQRDLRARIEALEAQNAELSSQLGRFPVRLVHRAAVLAARVRGRFSR